MNTRTEELRSKTKNELQEELRCCVAKTDLSVLKRLKFLHKILKAIPHQTSNRSRQIHIYILEVLDAINDWSGNENSQMEEILEQMFVLVCNLISTFNTQEFTEFQQIFAKYLIQRGEILSNFEVLDFLSNIYGFIASIAPLPVIEELVEVFTHECMPPHICLIILPSVLHNISDVHSPKLRDKLCKDKDFLFPKGKCKEEQLSLITDFWTELKTRANQKCSLRKLCQILCRCITSTNFLLPLPESHILLIMRNLIDWSESPDNIDAFLLISSVFLTFVCWNLSESPNSKMHLDMKILISNAVRETSNSKNREVRHFTLKVLQGVVTSQNGDYLDDIVKSFESEYNVCVASYKTDKEVEDALENLQIYIQRLNKMNLGKNTEIRKQVELLLKCF